LALIRPWASLDEDLEVLWLAGLFQTRDKGWQVRAIMRGVISRAVRQWDLPIGLLPLLAPGRGFSRGDLMRTPVTGRISHAGIPDLAAGEVVEANSVPRWLYSFEGHRGWGQHLLRYRIGWKTYLIPTMELVRYLFLHNKTLANAIMQPAGLLALAAPELPGHHPCLHLHFTRQMPRRSLSPLLVQEFAWLAVHPDGRLSWDSVRERTLGNRHVGLLVPPLQNCRMSFHGVEMRSTCLVLEIRQLSGRSLPCDHIRYSHPVERHLRYILDRDGASIRPVRRTPMSRDKQQPDSDEVEPTQGSRVDVHQKALPMLGKFSAFDAVVRVEKVKYVEDRPCAPDAVPHPAAGTVPEAKAGTGDSRAARPRTKAESSSVGESVDHNGLPPIEFQILEPAGWDYVGELGPLMAAINLMAGRHPALNVAMSLCYMKTGRAFSMAGRQDRVCLVAFFQLPGAPPTVLLDVDHSGIRGLSSLLLRYSRHCPLREMELHIKTLLDALVVRCGRWDTAAERALPEFVACRRLRKVLRQQGKQSDEDYLGAWTERLMGKVLGVGSV